MYIQSSAKAFNTFDIHILTVADFLERLRAPPVFSLTDVKADTRHTFSIVPATTVSAAKERMHGTETAERWLHQKGHDFHSSVLPYTLSLNLTLEDIKAARHTGLKLCIDDWCACAHQMMYTCTPSA